ncbi:DinB family protein, partial [Chloroflexota bacterium]
EIAWQSATDLNSIGLILFHTARSEDFFIQELVRQQPQIWEASGWTRHFNMTLEERGRHYKAEQVNAFVPPDIGDIRKYFTEVRAQTLEYIKTLKPEDYSREITTPRGTNTVHGFLTNIIKHSAQHAGEISYLRGLKRGLNQ